MAEAVIVEAVRTPIGKRNGVLSGIHPVDLLAMALRGLLERTGVDPQLIDDVIIGCVDQMGEQGANIARNAWLSAGLPESVPGTTVDRQCGSGLQAIHFAAQGVMAGVYDLVIAGGVESMSRVPILATIRGEHGTPLTNDLAKRYGLVSGWFDQAKGAEMMARRWNLSRETLDEFSYRSHMLAAEARQQGRFTPEIIPVASPGNGVAEPVVDDEGIRPDTTLEKMAALKPAFPGLDLITAGNSSQISDGAAVTLIASEDAARSLGLRPRARFVAFAVVGSDPVIMLTGPIAATHKVLQRAGLTVDDIDLFEVNEAFAPVVLAWQKEVGAPMDRVNVNGGAIALGHPLGATGARLTATLLHELERRKGRYGLMAICEGGGMANATIIERIA